MSNIGRYAEGAYNRQLVLDYVNEHPGVLGPHICEALGMEKSTCATRLVRMCDQKELRREKALIEVPCMGGKTQKLHTYAYWATATQTRSHEAVAQHVAANPRMKQATIKEGKWVGGSFRNTNDQRQATPCPDAMQGVGPRGMTYLEAMA